MRRFVILALAVVAVSSSSSRAQPAGPNKRVLCGCSSSRFLAKGPATVGELTLGAWLHGETQIDGFQQKDGGAVSPTSLPFQIVPDERLSNGASRFVKVRATDKGEGLLGIVRLGDKAPRDVLKASFSPGASPTAPSSSAPQVEALWLEPVEVRDRRDCGAYVTQRLAYETTPGSAAVEAFAIKNLDTGVTALVDARHVGAFGIGHVATCDHGFAVDTNAARVEIQPLSALGVAGEAWSFGHDGTGTTPVSRLSSPATANAERIAMPFPLPGEPTRPMSWFSVGGIWILVPAFGFACAFIAFIIWKLKRRKMLEVRCVSCGGTVAIDVLDKQTDGFFCPHCGTAGYWKGRGVDVDSTRL